MKRILTLIGLAIAGFTLIGQNSSGFSEAPDARNEFPSEVTLSIERPPAGSSKLQPGQAQQGFKNNTIGYAWDILPGTSTPEGPVFVDLATAAITSIKEVSTEIIWMSGADMVGETWYAVNHDNVNSGLYILETTTGSYDLVGQTGHTMTGLAYDVTTETLFASAITGGNSYLYSLNISNGEATLVGQIGSGVIIGIAADGLGNIYGISLSNNSLYSINRITGAGTLVGGLGININFAQDIAFDRDNNILYGTLYTNVGGLYTINVENGDATRVGFLYTELAGLAIPYSLSNDGAPGAVANLTAVPDPDGELEVELSWTNPTQQVDGDPLTELTAIYIERSGEIIDSIMNPVTGQPGTYTDNSVTETGAYLYSVFGVNSAGNGLKTFRLVFVGNDVPAAPGDVTLTSQGQDGFVTWTAPTEGLNGGSFDGEGLHYSILRMPDEIPVADNITETEFLDDLVTVTGYYWYIVTAYNDAGAGGSAASNVELLSADDVLMYEPFDYPVDALPSNWQLTGTVIHNWKISNTFNAGGMAPELRMHWASPANTGLSRVVSDPIDVEDLESVRFTYRMYLDSYNPGLGEVIGIDVSYDDGNTWSDIWETEIEGDIGPDVFELYFDVPDGSTEMRLGFRFDGVSNNITQWCIDELLLEAVVDNRLTVASVKGKKYPSAEKENVYRIAINNTGFNTQDDYTVKLMKGDNVELASVSGDPIAFGESLTYELTWIPDASDEGPMVIYGFVQFENDGFTGTNMSAPFVIRVLPTDEWSSDIGEGMITDVGPLVFGSAHSLQQTLYYPHEMGMGGGQITGIEITNHFNDDLNEQTFTVWVGETELDDLSSGWIDPATLQQVYSGSMDFPGGINEIMIPFDAPYEYNGANLVVYFHKAAPAWSPMKFFHNSLDEGSQRTRRARRASPAYNPLTPPATGTTLHDVFPNVTMLFTTEGLGGLAGTVTDGVAPVQGVNVKVMGTPVATLSGNDGSYSVPFISPGTYDIEFTRNGYDTLVVENITIITDETTLLDVELTAVDQYSVSGIVQGNDGVLLENALVVMEGYNDYSTHTDDAGEFLFDEIFQGLYTITVIAEGYEEYVQENIAVNDHLDLGVIEVTEIIVAPGLLEVQTEGLPGGSALFSWSENAFREFRFDDGTATGQIGSSQGTYNTVLGAAHRHDAVLAEISWFLTDNAGPHHMVKVWVFGLDENGMPDRNEVLYEAEDIANTDMQWNTYEFTQPVEAPNGFMIGLGYNGFIALGTDSGTHDQWPFQPNTNFASLNITTDDFAPIETMGDFSGNFLIRAWGEDFGEIEWENPVKGQTDVPVLAFTNIPLPGAIHAGTPEYSHVFDAAKVLVGFNVFLDGELQAEEIIATEYLFENLTEGYYTAGVQSVFTTGESEIVTIDFEIVDILDATIIVTTNSGDSPEGALVTLVHQDMDDMIYSQEAGSDGEVHFPDIHPGMYTLSVVLEGFYGYVVEDIDIQESFTYTAELEEIIELPYGLVVETEGLPHGEALLMWNQTPGKALEGYNVFLDDDLVAEELVGTQYLFTGLAAGDYTAGVQSVYTTGTSDIVTIDFVISTDVGTIDIHENFLTLYPNPASDNVMLRSDLVIRMVSVKDVSGRVVYTSVAEAEEYQLDVSSLGNGIYFVEVVTSSGISVLKMQVQK
ncbi:MAG: T9SS C-terminal target domain-containing protein [Bacteroidetes bacterium]|nr:MAG: T9SS C-terminal target domain-containing protein [Bacteroidota bacterium]